MDRSFVTAPLRLARAPWQRLDRALADRLPDDHPARRAIQGVLRASDSATRSAQRPDAAASDAAASDTAASDTGAGTTAIASPQRKRATAAKERATARGNRSPKAIVQDIAKIDAAAEARDHEAAAHHPADAPEGGS